jgi:hypothetical protein
MKNELIKNLSTKQIIESFNMINEMKESEIFTVRGWLMDELEKRNPKAFLNWIDGDPLKGPEFCFA